MLGKAAHTSPNGLSWQAKRFLPISMIITGTFTPTDGDPQPFKVFGKAEIEIEHEFESLLEVTEDNMQKVVSVNINPGQWLQ